MKRFATVQFDPDTCWMDLRDFEHLLASKNELSEASDLLPFFRTHPQLCSLIGAFYPDLFEATAYAFEFPIVGDFVADVVLKDERNGCVLLVEFEDAKTDSIFVRTQRSQSVWGRRLETGYGQIIDWLWRLSDIETSEAFEFSFGRRANYHALLVLGRDQFVDDVEKARLNWRFAKTVVNSKFVKCVTYDELLLLFTNQLKYFPEPQTQTVATS